MMWPSMQKVAGVRASFRRGRATRGMSMEGGDDRGEGTSRGDGDAVLDGVVGCASELAWRNEGNNEAKTAKKEMKENSLLTSIDVQD